MVVESLPGSVTSADPDEVVELAAQNGAEVLIPVDDRFYGRRDGRLKDPFGHLWIVGRAL